MTRFSIFPAAVAGMMLASPASAMVSLHSGGVCEISAVFWSDLGLPLAFAGIALAAGAVAYRFLKAA